VVRLENVRKTFVTRRGKVDALDGIDIEINKGEFLVVRGPSGSGKTTLLLTLGAMLRPTSGRVLYEDDDIYSMTSKERSKFRALNIGFVFQTFYLIPYLNIIDNVLLGSCVTSTPKSKDDVVNILEYLNLSKRAYHKPGELSTGERQRVAIARALVKDPKVILADEPTGNLDPDNAEQVMGYLSKYNKSGGTVVLVTHSKMAEEYADRILKIENGKIVKM